MKYFLFEYKSRKGGYDWLSGFFMVEYPFSKDLIVNMFIASVNYRFFL